MAIGCAGGAAGAPLDADDLGRELLPELTSNRSGWVHGVVNVHIEQFRALNDLLQQSLVVDGRASRRLAGGIRWRQEHRNGSLNTRSRLVNVGSRGWQYDIRCGYEPADLPLADIHRDECRARAVGVAGKLTGGMPDFLGHIGGERSAAVVGVGN